MVGREGGEAASEQSQTAEPECGGRGSEQEQREKLPVRQRKRSRQQRGGTSEGRIGSGTSQNAAKALSLHQPYGRSFSNVFRDNIENRSFRERHNGFTN